MSKLKAWGHLRVGDEVQFVGGDRRGGGTIAGIRKKAQPGFDGVVWVHVKGDGWEVEVRPTDVELRSLLDRLAREAG